MRLFKKSKTPPGQQKTTESHMNRLIAWYRELLKKFHPGINDNNSNTYSTPAQPLSNEQGTMAWIDDTAAKYHKKAGNPGFY